MKDLHEVQKYILNKLSISKKARYSKLKPPNIESNQFAYHLKKLIEENIIASKEQDYTLTSHGKQIMDRMSFKSFKERIQPKIVTIIVLEHKGKYLFYERDRVPFIGYIGFPYGKIHLEERIHEAAERELKEKTSLASKLKHRGDVYLTVHDETELVSHMLCHVFSGTYKNTAANTALPKNCFWSSLDSVSKSKLIPGVSQIIKALKKNDSKFFFDEFFLNV